MGFPDPRPKETNLWDVQRYCLADIVLAGYAWRGPGMPPGAIRGIGATVQVKNWKMARRPENPSLRTLGSRSGATQEICRRDLLGISTTEVVSKTAGGSQSDGPKPWTVSFRETGSSSKAAKGMVPILTIDSPATEILSPTEPGSNPRFQGAEFRHAPHWAGPNFLPGC